MAGGAQRQTISTDELKDRLLAQLDLLVHQLAPPAKGAYTKGDLYFTLNPGRADRSVGSFCIHMSGPKAGRWIDYAVPGKDGRGDVIDLFSLALGLDPKAAFREARRWLGLDTEDPAMRRAREDQARRLKVEREARAQAAEADLERTRRMAAAVWLSAQEKIIGTPVDLYLQGRGIDLSVLPHLPGAIRYHAECRYYWVEVQPERIDPETGEVFPEQRRRQWRPMPAMVTAIALGKRIIDCHRTYLAIGPEGRWVKAALEDNKKVFADYTGGSIRLSGGLGPRGGMVKLNQCPPQSRVYITEGIENGLSLIMLRHLAGQPPAFVVAAGSLWNMAHVELPANVTEVVLAADNDGHAQAREGLERAIGFHSSKGRAVRVWRSAVPGEDLNDALKRALQDEGRAA